MPAKALSLNAPSSVIWAKLASTMVEERKLTMTARVHRLSGARSQQYLLLLPTRRGHGSALALGVGIASMGTCSESNLLVTMIE